MFFYYINMMETKLPKDSKYIPWLRKELCLTKTKVQKWLKWDYEKGSYEAFVDSRRVNIPIPICDWSFLVALHELGHVSTGLRLHSYLSEYNAEMWAIRRANDSYGVTSLSYVSDAKLYVKDHLLENLIYGDLKVHSVKNHVLEWLGENEESIINQILSLLSHNLVESDKGVIDYDYWLAVAK